MTTAHLNPQHCAMLDQVEHALMELSVLSATLRDMAAGTRADRVAISPQGLRNYFHFQQERSDAALKVLRAVRYAGPPTNHCRVA